MLCFLCWMKHSRRHIAVIGGGPAGLRAAEVAAEAGARVTLYDAMRSVGRKFLVAGKSGLNLTNSAGPESFLSHYSGRDFPVDRWRGYLAAFNNYDLSDWASGLGVDCFAAPNGKVFPISKKAAPLLRAWVLRLRAAGVVFRMQHAWAGLERHGASLRLRFDVAGNPFEADHDAVVLAMGGASWPQTGSTGAWVAILEALGIEVVPLRSANCGWEYAWTEATRALIEGNPLQNLEVHAHDKTETGELVVTRYGLEGPPLYALGPELRAMAEPAIEIDFKPSFTEARLVAKMESARRDFYKEAGLRWKLSPTACAILRDRYGQFDNAVDLARVVKRCRLPLTRPRPIAEAISTAGGVAWAELDADLMLRRLPGVYCAGEMLDWEAPTGGFLMQGSFATGDAAGRAAASPVKCSGLASGDTGGVAP
jgi:uncharacterized flavoprotein (TIGR03862 family)